VFLHKGFSAQRYNWPVVVWLQGFKLLYNIVRFF